MTGQVRELLAADPVLTDEAKSLVLAALNGQSALRSRLTRLDGQGDTAVDEGDTMAMRARTPWFGRGPSMLRDAVTRFLGLGAIAVAEHALSAELRDARTTRRQAIDGLAALQAALANSTDPRAATARALLAQPIAVDPDAVAALAAVRVDIDQLRTLDLVISARVLDPDEVRARVLRIRSAQQAAMAADREGADYRANLWGMRRELSELLAEFPDINWLPGVDAEITGRYLVARSAARALAIWMRNADAVEVRVLELADAFAEVQRAARPARAAVDDTEVAWAAIAARLSTWLTQSRDLRANSIRMRALAEAGEWLVRNGKVLCAGRYGMTGSIGA